MREKLKREKEEVCIQYMADVPSGAEPPFRQREEKERKEREEKKRKEREEEAAKEVCVVVVHPPSFCVLCLASGILG